MAMERPGTAGLSPRVRGNLADDGDLGAMQGSIPASAGEPPTETRVASYAEVYPRECGGTLVLWPERLIGQGLSPRVRGNPGIPARRRRVLRSIPASAGEPIAIAFFMVFLRVYPRECGGTIFRRPKPALPEGLSPRVRGNQLGFRRLVFRVGSIPASAGEPGSGELFLDKFEVYPRECGGTTAGSSSSSSWCGLSPRVRGNHQRAHDHAEGRGSIPASAGEPRTASMRGATAEVYPRECGGTRLAPGARRESMGLSPRVRGNRPRAPALLAGIRSIPASAGEPAERWQCRWLPRVYPRECGGTAA